MCTAYGNFAILLHLMQHVTGYLLVLMLMGSKNRFVKIMTVMAVEVLSFMCGMVLMLNADLT